MKKIKNKISKLKGRTESKLNDIKPKSIKEAYELSKDLLEEGGKLAINSLRTKSLHEKVFSGFSENATKMSGAIGAFLSDNQLLKHLETLTESASTVYDKALDSEYLKSHIGGGDHRLFDNGHDIINAWDKVREALPDDSLDQEVLGYVSSLWKDLSTVKGLPFATVSKESFESWVKTTSEWIPGMDRKYMYDLLSFDAYELLATGLGAVSVIFALKKDDQEKLADLLGSMGIVSILSANPLMGIFVIGTSAFAYSKKKMEFDKSAFTKSAIITSSSMALFSILGMPILFELVIVAVATRALRKKVLDNHELQGTIKDKARSLISSNIKRTA